MKETVGADSENSISVTALFCVCINSGEGVFFLLIFLSVGYFQVFFFLKCW